MNEHELEKEIQHTYDHLQAQDKLVERAMEKRREIDSRLTDLNTALRVLKSLKG